jgi:hypothetical protein
MHSISPIRFVVLIFGILAVAARAQNDGTLTVKTQPEGIEVWLDDKYIGDSPIMDKKLKPGRYQLKLVDGIQHTSQSEEVFIQAGQTALIEKTIVSKFGSLRVTSEPPGAEVLLLTSLGETPVSNEFMNPGKYRLEVRYPGKNYKPATEDITIPRGELVSVDKTLEAKKALDTKALVRLALGAGAIGGFVWAIVEQGEYKSNQKQADYSSAQTYRDKAAAANAWKWVGVAGGSLCVVGFEIVAFF